MRTNPLKYRFLITFVFILLSFYADAEEDRLSVDIKLQNLKESVLKTPVEALSELKQIESSISKEEQSSYFLWKLRKIQALNYSYQFNEFNALLSSTIEESDEKVSLEVLAYLYMFDGVRLQRQGHYSKSIKQLRKSIEYSIKDGAEEIQTIALVELTYALSLAEQYELAMLELQSAYQLANKLKNPFLSGLTEESNATLLGYRDDYKASIERYLKAEQFYRKLDYPYYLGEVAYGIASTYRYSGDYELALKWYTKYFDAIKSFESEYTTFFFNYGMAMTYAQKGDCRNVLKSVNRVISVTEFKDYKAELFKKMSLCLGTLGDFVAADIALDEAKLIYMEIPELKGTTWELELYKIEAQLKAMKKDYQSAYEKLESYYQQYLEVQKVNASERLDKLRLAVLDERKKHELTMLEKQAQLQQAEIKNKSRQNEIQRLWLMGSMILIAIILTILFWQVRINRKFKSLAIIDELTGLYNRRYIFSAIESVLKKPNSGKIFHTVMLIDIDNLKPINDKYGHQAGDQVIRAIADTGQKVIRDGDIFARIGGDEFMVFLSRTEKEPNETSIAERLRESIKDTSIHSVDGEKINIGISIGVASMERRKDSLEAIYSRVDKALYRAKSNDTYKIVHWSEEL